MNTNSASPASDRTQTNIDTFIAPAPEAGGITLRPFSAGTLTICRALGLTMVVGGDKEQVEALSGPNGWLRDVYGQAQLEGGSE